MSDDTYLWVTSPSARERRRTGEKASVSPPMTGKNPARLTRNGPGSGSNLVSGMKMYATSMTDYTSRESETLTSPTSPAFLMSMLFPTIGESKTILNVESVGAVEARWDSKFSLHAAPYGGREGDAKILACEEVAVDEDPIELRRQAMSSGSSNASSDSVTSTSSQGSRSGSQSSSAMWADFSSPLWDTDLFGTESRLFDDIAPYSEELELFMTSYYAHLKSSKVRTNWSPGVSHLKHVTDTLERFSASRSLMLRDLAASMNAKLLIVPCAEFDLPTEAILLLNSTKSTVHPAETSTGSSASSSPSSSPLSPQEASLLALYSQNPVFAAELNRLRWFLDRLDTNKQVLAFFVWSLPDAALVALTCSKVLPYPLCRGCSSQFGVRSCGQCQIAKYCSRACQVSDWELDHQSHCSEMRDSLADRIHTLELVIETQLDDSGPSSVPTQHSLSSPSS